MKAELLLGLALATAAGCQQKMAANGRILPLEAGSLRAPVEGTVARSARLEDPPQPAMSLALLKRGRERFGIYCSPCHNDLGDGRGIVVQRGLTAPPSYLIDRLRKAPDQHFYDVITKGYGAMLSYASRVPPDDRWAITAYIRALQLSQAAPRAKLSEEDLRKLEGGGG